MKPSSAICLVSLIPGYGHAVDLVRPFGLRNWVAYLHCRVSPEIPVPTGKASWCRPTWTTSTIATQPRKISRLRVLNHAPDLAQRQFPSPPNWVGGHRSTTGRVKSISTRPTLPVRGKRATQPGPSRNSERSSAALSMWPRAGYTLFSSSNVCSRARISERSRPAIPCKSP